MRYRLTLILAAALLALVVTSRSRPAASEAGGVDPQSASLLSPVPQDHWAYPALAQLSDGKMSIPIGRGPNATKPVTRFEMAVLLSRIMEKLDAAGSGKLPAEKLELLEKLTKEFRSDLDAIGADMTLVKARVEQLARKVDEGHGPGSGSLVKQVFDTNQKVDDVAGKVKAEAKEMEAMSAKLTAQGNQLAESHKRIKVYAEVLAKVLVKMARLEKTGAREGDGSQALSRSSLNEIRGLIKEFAIDFEQRLSRVERGSGVQIPAASQLPVPRGAPADPDHIFDSETSEPEPPTGPPAP